MAVLVRAGMRPAGGLVLFDRPVALRASVLPAGVTIRDGAPADLGALRPIALALAETSRFGRVAVLGPDAAPRLYERWLERSLAGAAAHAVLVAERAGEPIGLVTLAHAEPDADELVLVGVRPDAQGRGVAGALIEAAAARVAQDGRSSLLVKSALDNVAAQRFYQRGGFRTRRVFLVLEHASARSGAGAGD
jgi:ribosomal protein S18 acetylase RimI-like enzyme